MRIVAWNCGGAFHRKWQHIAALQPDVAIISECCQPDQLAGLGFTSATWVGRLHYKGLGVFGFANWQVTPIPVDEQLEWVLPVAVSGPAELTVVGLWAMNHRAASHPERFTGVRQAVALADVLDLDNSPGPVVVAGDFNSHPIWDKPHKPTFQRTRERLEHAGLVSMYHATTGEKHGEETAPTHWWRNRTADGPTYHIDYMWLSQNLAATAQLTLGRYSDWVTAAGSDHAAMILDFAIES